MKYPTLISVPFFVDTAVQVDCQTPSQEKEQLLLTELSEIKLLYKAKEKEISSLKEAVHEKMTALKEDDSKQKELKMLQQIGKLNEFT